MGDKADLAPFAPLTNACKRIGNLGFAQRRAEELDPLCRSGDFRREHKCTTIGAGATCRTCGKHREKYFDL